MNECTVCGQIHTTTRDPEPPMRFEVANAFNPGGSGFDVTNEEPYSHHDILKGIRIRRAGAICSGGEILFFNLLPRVTRELVAVDHSLKSLRAAYLKAAMLASLGARKTVKILTSPDQKQATEVFERLVLPEAIKTGHKVYNPATPFAGYDFPNVRYHWRMAPFHNIARSARKLHKLTLVHGDLGDLAAKGPFDLVYISNALEHTGRDGKSPDPAVIRSMVRTGGLVLGTTSASYWTPRPHMEAAYKKYQLHNQPGFELFRNAMSLRDGQWHYWLCRAV